jgi:hypothetical protein
VTAARSPFFIGRSRSEPTKPSNAKKVIGEDSATAAQNAPDPSGARAPQREALRFRTTTGFNHIGA